MIMNVQDNSKDVEELKNTVGYKPYPSSKNYLEVTVPSQTLTSTSFTVNDDGSVIFNGTATSDNSFLLKKEMFYLPEGEYILSGCPEGGGPTIYRLLVYNSAGTTFDDYGEGVSFTSNGEWFYNPRIYINKNTSANNLTFYPMIRKADITDDTYEMCRKGKETVDNRFNTLESTIRGIDTAYSLHSFTASGNASNGKNDVSYVAEKDCYAVIRYYGASTAKIYLDNLTVFQTNDKVARIFIMPIKKGQKVRGYTSDAVGSYVTCEFYGLL